MVDGKKEHEPGFLGDIDIKDNVSDLAGMLSRKDIRSIDRAIRSIECKTDAEIAVITVDSLGGRNIDEVAVELFDSFGIGKKGLNNGMLFLISRKDNEYRIEVGEGLEGLIDDDLEKNLKEKLIVPYFREKKFGIAILKFINATAKKIYKDKSSKIALAALVLGSVSLASLIIGMIISALLAFNTYIDIHGNITVLLLFINIFIPAAGTGLSAIIVGAVDIIGVRNGMFIETRIVKSITGITIGAIVLIALVILFYFFSDFILAMASLFNIASVSY